MNRPLLKRKIVVSLDNRRGGRLATRHLFKQGYQKVGIITGPMDWWEAQERLAGWREVMQEKGVVNLDKLVFEGDWGVDSGDCGFEALYAANPDLDAIFVSNDQMSLGVIQAANRNGRKIPGDLGIVVLTTSRIEIFLSSSDHHKPGDTRPGALAVTRLYECIHEKEDIDKCIREGQNMIAPELVIRQSSSHP